MVLFDSVAESLALFTSPDSVVAEVHILRYVCHRYSGMYVPMCMYVHAYVRMHAHCMTYAWTHLPTHLPKHTCLAAE